MNRMRMSMVIALGLLAVGAARVEAQTGIYRGYLTGQVGLTAGGDAPDPALTPSASVSVQDDSGWGAELDLGFAHIGRSSRPDLDLTTYMVNVNWMAQTGRVRPYAVGGAGAIHVRGCFSACAAIASVYDVGLNAGGGALYPVNDTMAVRGDVRYFWAPGDKSGSTRPANYGFWRVSVGATFKWDIVP